MQLIPQFNDLTRYLEASEVIDFGRDAVCPITDLSLKIAAYSKDEIDYIRNAFEYVRDHIFHSADINGSKVTCRASDVLLVREGICYAKAHLLAAVLRCNRIPAGFCYQRILLDDDLAPYLVLHGLNAVYIAKYDRWVRLDTRGNKPGVDAQFSLEQERLAFPVRAEKGEKDIPIVFACPDEGVIRALTVHESLDALWANLPTELHAY